jgi:hypothetical protein
MRIPRYVLGGVLLGIVAQAAHGQIDSTFVGQRVRVRIRDVHRQAELLPPVLELRGTVLSVTGDTLALRLPSAGSPVSIPRPAITSLAVSRGVPSPLESAGRRMLEWGATGACLGLLYLHSPIRDSGHTWEDAVGTGASLGSLTGLLVGFISPYERWRGVRVR